MTKLQVQAWGWIVACATGCGSDFMKDDTGGAIASEASDGVPEIEDESPGADPSPPPEEEREITALRPATTPRFTFVANAERNTLTRVEVDTLRVVTARVGTHPTQVVTSPDYSRAVTFNAGSDDLSVVDALTMEVQNIPIRANRNWMETSADGRWALCFVHPDVPTISPTAGAQSYNEFSLVDLDAQWEWPMVTGTNPQAARFSADSSVAVVVSHGYLSRIDLRADVPAPSHVELLPGVLDAPVAEEFVLTPDGSAAIVRLFGLDELIHIDLATMEKTTLSVGDNPTDLDLSPDGNQLVAVARNSHELWLYDLDDLLADPEVISLPPDVMLGSITLSPDGQQALLYSTVSEEPLYALWDTNTDDITVRELVKSVQAVGISPTGTTAIVSHSAADGPDIDLDSPYSGAPALTLIDLDTLFSTALVLPAETSTFAHTDDGQTGFFIMDDQPYLEILDFQTLVHEEVALKSRPLFLGTLPETRTAFVSQDHHLGRISFFNLEEDQLQTVTGFELNADIEN